MTGFVVSTTFTVLVTSSAVFPFASVTLQVTVYVPNIVVSTEFTVTILSVIFPSQLSLAVAPASVQVLPTSTVTSASPVNVMTGFVVSTTFTVLTNSIALFPDVSVTL